MEEKYLPIGSVVMLKEGTKRTMIIGYYVISEDGNKYDYAACLYPEGVLTSDKTLLFNHDQIDEVYAKGFMDEEQKEYMNKLKELISEKEGNNIAMPVVKEVPQKEIKTPPAISSTQIDVPTIESISKVNVN